MSDNRSNSEKLRSLMARLFRDAEFDPGRRKALVQGACAVAGAAIPGANVPLEALQAVASGNVAKITAPIMMESARTVYAQMLSDCGATEELACLLGEDVLDESISFGNELELLDTYLRGKNSVVLDAKTKSLLARCTAGDLNKAAEAMCARVNAYKERYIAAYQICMREPDLARTAMGQVDASMMQQFRGFIPDGYEYNRLSSVARKGIESAKQLPVSSKGFVQGFLDNSNETLAGENWIERFADFNHSDYVPFQTDDVPDIIRGSYCQMDISHALKRVTGHQIPGTEQWREIDMCEDAGKEPSFREDNPKLQELRNQHAKKVRGVAGQLGELRRHGNGTSHQERLDRVASGEFQASEARNQKDGLAR